MRSNWMRVAWVALVLASALAVPMLAEAQGSGRLEGNVVNGTAGAPQVGAGIVVRLVVDGGDAAAQEAVTDGQGRFQFDGLDSDPALTYRAEAVYLDVPYASEAVQFSDGETAVNASVTVYETTDDGSAVVADSVHLIVESFGSVLRVTEVHILGNSSDRTFVGKADSRAGGRRTTVSVPLPSNAVGLALDEVEPGARFVEAEGAVLDTAPVPAGEQTSALQFSYHLMVGDGPTPLERSYPYPVSVVSVLVAQPGLSLSSEQLGDAGVIPFEDRQFQVFEAGNLPAGTPVVMGLVQTEAGAEGTLGTTTGGQQAVTAGSAVGSQGLLRWLGFALVILAVAGVAAYVAARPLPLRRARTQSTLANDPKARRLLDELVDLEEAVAEGGVDPDTYEREREERTQSLKSLMR